MGPRPSPRDEGTLARQAQVIQDQGIVRTWGAAMLRPYTNESD
jgi:hypothetical protein